MTLPLRVTAHQGGVATGVVVEVSANGLRARLDRSLAPGAAVRLSIALTDGGPPVDALGLVVRAEVPGFRKEDIEVSVSGNTLTLSGEMRTEDQEEKGSYYRAEITRGAFSRTLALPALERLRQAA